MTRVTIPVIIDVGVEDEMLFWMYDPKPLGKWVEGSDYTLFDFYNEEDVIIFKLKFGL